MDRLNKLSLALAMTGFAALMPACGTEGMDAVDLAAGSSQGAALSPVARDVLSSVLYIMEGQDGGKSGVACKIKRGNLFESRQVLKLGYDWSNFTSTKAFEIFSNNYSTYKKAGCSTGDFRDECNALREKLEVDAASLASTPEWGVLTHNSRFISIQKDFAEAAADGCVVAPTL